MEKEKSLEYMLEVQFNGNGRWEDEDGPYSNIEFAKGRMEYLRGRYPQHRYRLCKREVFPWEVMLDE